jgi:nicotinamide-nucleotide amidase
MLVTAESCTGGGVAHVVTSVPGSSSWFDRGFVTYSDRSKQEMLGVRRDTLDQFGAVSEEVVREMAEGALARSGAGVSVAISGIAGPDGGSPRKPVGTVWFAWVSPGHPTRCRSSHYAGDREMVRQQAVLAALQGILESVP